MFIFVRCPRSLAVVTPVKYECDILQVTSVWWFWKTGKITEEIWFSDPNPGLRDSLGVFELGYHCLSMCGAQLVPSHCLYYFYICHCITEIERRHYDILIITGGLKGYQIYLTFKIFDDDKPVSGWQPYQLSLYYWNRKTVTVTSLSLLVLRLEYSRITRSTRWLIMPWILLVTGHQQLQYWLCRVNHMMMSSNGNIFRVTGPLCGEFTGHWWIPLTKASDAELWCFLWSVAEEMVE